MKTGDEPLLKASSPVYGGLFLLLIYHAAEGYLRLSGISRVLFSDDLFHSCQYFFDAVL